MIFSPLRVICASVARLVSHPESTIRVLTRSLDMNSKTLHETVQPEPADTEGFWVLFEALWSDLARWFMRGLKAGALFGVLIAAAYFARIGHFPLDSVSSLTAVGQIVAVFGFLYALATLFLWGFPVYVMHFALKVTPMAVRPWFVANRQPDVWRIVVWCASTIGMGWIGLFAWAIPDYFFGQDHRPETVLGLTAVGLLGALPFIGNESRRNDVEGTPLPPAARWRGRLGRLSLSVFCAVSSVYPMLVLLKLAGASSFADAQDAATVWAVIGVGWVLIVITNAFGLAVGTQQRFKPGIAAAVQGATVMLTLVLLVAALGAGTGLINQLMAVASVRVSSASLVLSEPACKMLSQLGAEVRTNARSSAADTDQCVLTDVTVLSTLGSRWPLACERTSTTPQPGAVWVSAEHVLAVAHGQHPRMFDHANARSLCAAVPQLGSDNSGQ
jgi:hypothetical protein